MPCSLSAEGVKNLKEVRSGEAFLMKIKHHGGNQGEILLSCILNPNPSYSRLSCMCSIFFSLKNSLQFFCVLFLLACEWLFI